MASNGVVWNISVEAKDKAIRSCDCPTDILHQIEQGRQLPYFIYDEEASAERDRFDILLHANAFDVESAAGSSEVRANFGSGSADIVVGNPPWNTPPPENTEGREALARAEIWCRHRGFPVGNKSLPQMFVWRAFDLLREGGCAALLLSTGVFFHHHSGTQAFRRVWLERVQLDEVANFAHVRRLFFTEGTSPFAAVTFTKCGEGGPSPRHTFQYWSAKRTARIEQSQAVVLSRADLNVIQQSELQNNDRLWKVYWWGSHRDATLLRALDLNPRLEEWISVRGRGFQGGEKGAGKKFPSDWLRLYRPLKLFQSYGPLAPDAFGDSVPDMVHRRGQRDVYDGWRLLITRGKSTEGKRLRARIAEQPFCFRHSIQGYKLKDPEPWKYEAVLGILWSSLARYYLFLTSGAWGLWHDETHIEEVLRLPIRLPARETDCEGLLRVVRQLRTWSWEPEMRDLFHQSVLPQEEAEQQLQALERELDEAVFDLYRLSQSDRALVQDLCDYGFDLLYRGHDGYAASPVALPRGSQGLFTDLPATASKGMPAYLRAFLSVWNQELPSGEFGWSVIHPQSDWPLIAAVFTVSGSRAAPSPSDESKRLRWDSALDKLSRALLTPYGSERIYIDGFARVVTDTDIIIIKRNEQRLWTRSAAYEDAEATLLQVMQLRAAEQST